VGRINNAEALVAEAFAHGTTHFLEMSGGNINATELVAALINAKDSIPEGIRYAQERIDGSMSMLVLTPKGLYAARDRMGRTPVVIGRKDEGYCAVFESSAYLNLGYADYRELGPGEVDFITADSVTVVAPPEKEMKMCAFLWVYYGYPSSTYEGMSVEQMRYRCGELLAQRDGVEADSVAGVPDSGIAHAVGYSTRSGIPFSRPFIKYTPTWPRSFMPQKQTQRNLIARMKLIPVDALIRGKRLVLIDDSIVRGTQLRETTEFLYQSGAKEVHVRTGCPPIMFSCKYLNFSRSTSEMDLITRRMIAKLEKGDGNARLDVYSDPDTPEYAAMVEEVRKEMKFTTLKYHRLDDMIAATGIDPDKLCTYCWNGKQ
jgi:amidophosphoribosyltransferase